MGLQSVACSRRLRNLSPPRAGWLQSAPKVKSGKLKTLKIGVAMANTSVAKRNYPWTTTLDDRRVTLRLMQAKDRDALLAFARSLPSDDLLFLSIDITEPEAVDGWAREVEAGRTVTVLAEADGKLVGHGTLTCNNLTWTLHLGEMQLLISPDFRGHGLGNLLADEVNAIARAKDLQKVVARMASEQT